MEKRGQVGLDVAKNVMLVLMIIGVLAFAMIIVLASVNNSDVASTSSGTLQNQETLATVTETGEDLTVSTLPDVACSLLSVTNASSGTTIPASNYTQTNCNLAFTIGDVLGINNSNWNVTYSYTYNSFDRTSGNVTGGVASFFSNTTTWFSLLAIVVIILIISIVILAVNRFGNRTAGL